MVILPLSVHVLKSLPILLILFPPFSPISKSLFQKGLQYQQAAFLNQRMVKKQKMEI